MTPKERKILKDVIDVLIGLNTLYNKEKEMRRFVDIQDYEHAAYIKAEIDAIKKLMPSVETLKSWSNYLINPNDQL